PRAEAEAEAEDDSIGANISASYFELRRNMLIIALVFPLVLMALGGLGDIQGSLSAYYHHDARGTRTVFTGVLWAVGAFLVFYKGYSDGENIALNIAGLSALTVSLFPMDWPEDAAATISGRVHYISAAIFFLAIAYVCIFRYKDTLQLMKDETRRAAFANSYRVIGALMVLLPPGIFAIFQIAPRAADAQGFPVILAVEAVGIWVFAAFWLTKSKEIALLEKQ
ncbi:MAG: hypothetical protein HKN78_05460, partial [Sphingomonadaceae bacterium]|nr:hypothetical protein [Sphingomonadaceae bacterium]